MQYPPFIAFDLTRVCANSQQIKCIADIYIPRLDLLCNGIIKWDEHAQDFITETAWILYLINKEDAYAISARHNDAQNVWIPRGLYNNIEGTLLQLIQDNSIENYEDNWETVEIVKPASNSADASNDLDKLQIITIH